MSTSNEFFENLIRKRKWCTQPSIWIWRLQSMENLILRLAWEILKSLFASRRLLDVLFKLIVDSEAFISFSARARSGLSEPGRVAIHWIVVEKILNFDLEATDLRFGVHAPRGPCDGLAFCLLTRVDFCMRDSEIDDGDSFWIASSLSSWGSVLYLSFKIFRFRMLLTSNVPLCMNCANNSFSKVVISWEIAKYWLKADRFKKLRSELSSSSICFWSSLRLKEGRRNHIKRESKLQISAKARAHIVRFCVVGGNKCKARGKV